MKSKNKLQNNSGFAVIEGIIIVVVAAAIIGVLYLWSTQQNSNDDNESNPQVTPTAEPIPTDSSDEELNQSSDEFNDLIVEVETLNEIDAELQPPQLDFDY